MILPNGNSVYFTGFDKDGDLENFTPDIDEIKKNCQIMTGTGFFINDKGTIITNKLTGTNIKSPYNKSSCRSSSIRHG